MAHSPTFYTSGAYERQLVLKQELVYLKQALRHVYAERKRFSLYLKTVTKYLNIKKGQISSTGEPSEKNYLQLLKAKLNAVNYNIAFIENGLAQLKISHNHVIEEELQNVINNKILEAEKKLNLWNQWKKIYHNKLIWLNTPIGILQRLYIEKKRDIENIEENLKQLKDLIRRLEEELAG